MFEVKLNGRTGPGKKDEFSQRYVLNPKKECSDLSFEVSQELKNGLTLTTAVNKDLELTADFMAKNFLLPDTSSTFKISNIPAKHNFKDGKKPDISLGFSQKLNQSFKYSLKVIFAIFENCIN